MGSCMLPSCIKSSPYDSRVSRMNARALPYEKPLLWDPEFTVAYFNRAPYTYSVSVQDPSSRRLDDEQLRGELIPVMASHRSTYGYEEIDQSYIVTFCHDSHRPIRRYEGLADMILNLARRAMINGLGLVLVLAGWDALTSHKESFLMLFEPFFHPEFSRFKIELHVYSYDPRKFYTMDPRKVCQVFNEPFPYTYEGAPQSEQVFMDCLRVCFMRELKREYHNIENLVAEHKRLGTKINFRLSPGHSAEEEYAATTLSMPLRWPEESESMETPQLETSK